MKAVVFHGIGDIRLDEVPDPERVLSQKAALTSALDAYGKFDTRKNGRLKVALTLA